MWILDTAFRNGVDIWCRNSTASCRHAAYDPPFYLHLPDPHAHHELVSALEDEYRAEPCTFRTIFGRLEGFSVQGNRAVAEAIEQQTRFEARLFNVDLRRDQQYLAEQGLVCCGSEGESRFTPDFTWDLACLDIRIRADPARTPLPDEIEIAGDRTEQLHGEGARVTADLFSLVAAHDPDLILMSQADAWMPRFHTFAEKHGLVLPFSRNGKYRRMSSRSYWSYGRMEHKEAALIPDGRILIDTDQSFMYREGGVAGVFMASRLSGLPPNTVSRLTPGTLISSYEVYEAVKRGIVVPFRKTDAEALRRFSDLRSADRGGMMFQPSPGIYDNVDELDFTSMYPSIIVKFNLSPETIGTGAGRGFLADVLDPVVALRKETKKKKAAAPQYAGIDSMLKWMLVTCFGYTGYKNARFGRIELHEAITARSRDILLQSKEIAEAMGFRVLHGIVDCLWVQGSPARELQLRIASATGLPLELEHFSWIVFLPLSNGFGAYNRYYGRLADGGIRIRGIAARRHDTPDYIRAMQEQMFAVMQQAGSASAVQVRRDEIFRLYRTAVAGLPRADPATLAITRRISRTAYAHRCLEGAAVQAFRDAGMEIAPGMEIRYVVRNARRYEVDLPWAASTADLPYYRTLLEKAWNEIAWAFAWGDDPDVRGWKAQQDLAGAAPPIENPGRAGFPAGGPGCPRGRFE